MGEAWIPEQRFGIHPLLTVHFSTVGAIGEVRSDDEQQFNEIEERMFELSGACRRARKIAMLKNAKAFEHLVEAMPNKLAEMELSHKCLVRGTYFAVFEMREPPEQATTV